MNGNGFKPFTNLKNLRCGGFCFLIKIIAHNVPPLGEGGDFNHKCQCRERMLNIAQMFLRRTEPPLLPNVCYAFGLFQELNFNN